MSDVRISAARDFHVRAGDAESRADRYRTRRDKLIRELRAEDPVRWTYPHLARVIGCSTPLVAHIVRSGRKKASE